MANPNIVNVSTINGETNFINVSTSNTAIVDNNGASGKVYKLNVVTVSNIDGINDADVSMFYRENYSDGTAANNDYYIVKTVTVPADSTLVVVDKNSSIYIKEYDAVMISASASGDLQAMATWEEIS